MGKEELEFAFHSFTAATIQQRTGGFNKAVVVHKGIYYRVPDKATPGSAKPLADRYKPFWESVYKQVTKAQPIWLMAFAPNSVQQNTVERWLPEPDNRD